MKPQVHFFGGQGIGWALDEDLDRARQALGENVHAGSFACSPIIHSAWWPPLLGVGARALQGKSVVCFADNPPAFYLTRPGFEEAAARVDLWIGRSQEAVRQFGELGLPVMLAPYTVDPKIFFPLPAAERQRIREDLGFSADDFVVGNFHRDSLERDVSIPKAQKGPDRFVEIVAEAQKTLPHLKVLLAGPRRHWIRGELARREILFVFSGSLQTDDDFSVNVLPRAELNRLYSALDCAVIPSRWEGGPYSVLEALFARCPVISTRVGMAADLLEGWLFSSPGEGAALLIKIASERPDFDSLRVAALESHSSKALAAALLSAYSRFAPRKESTLRAISASAHALLARLHPAFRTSFGANGRVAEAMSNVRNRASDKRRVVADAVGIAEAEASVQRP